MNKGLSDHDVKKKLEEHGFNEIKEIAHVSPVKILLRQIEHNFIIYLLTAALILSFIVGKSVTAYALLGVIVLVIGVGFFQEYKAERAIKALKGMLTPLSIVLRNGKEQQISSRLLVPGDIVLLRIGERVPADCIVLEAKELTVDESVLTGESREIEKFPKKNSESDEQNFIFMGSFIARGKCIACVIHTGMNTKFGSIAALISTTEKDLPLQKKINAIAKVMVFVAIGISLLTGALMILRAEELTGEFLINVLILVIAISVSAFPEGLPVVLITSLAAGAYRMAGKNAIVNRMSIIETLGETTVICTDKTGTITKGEMTVNTIFTDASLFSVSGTGYYGEGHFLLDGKIIDPQKNPVLTKLLLGATLCNDARIELKSIDHEYTVLGAPTEVALLILAAKAQIFKEDLLCERTEEIPFSSERKIMSVLCTTGKESFVYAKGAPEVVLRACTHIQRKDGVFKLTAKDRALILGTNTKLTSRALRTLALAYKKTSKKSEKYLEEELIFLGLIGMEDPPREEVKEALRLCTTAGITVKMITGDHKDTAVAIAHQIGLHGDVLEGKDLDEYTDKELEALVQTTSIFARVRPDHKIRIVRALKARHEIVTMTGDGVNDAPALKEAHIGVAMGKSGTDVSREVADLILRDDNFATIVSAIQEGRTIFNNMRKFVTYQLSCNYAELFILFIGTLLAPLFGWQIPVLLALQILFMNLVTDNLPAITLGFNPSSPDIMQKKPLRNPGILNKSLLGILFLFGTLMGILTLGVYYYTFSVLGTSIEVARTTALVTLIFLEIANAFTFRSFRNGVLTRSPFVNMPLILASLISVIATLVIVYTPIHVVFETVPIPLFYWLLAAGVSSIIIILADILKKINKEYSFIPDLI